MASYVAVMGSILFVLTYIFMAFKIKFFPIGRTLSTMTGSVLLLIFGILSPSSALSSISLETITLLFGTMTMTILLEREGFFKYVLNFLVYRCHSGYFLIIRVCFVAGFLSALVTNDTVCVFLTPIIVEICELYDLKHGPFLMGLATSANIGSTLSPVGNPQNMIIANLSGIPFRDFIVNIGCSCVLCLSLNSLMLIFYYKRELSNKRISSSNQLFVRAEESQQYIEKIHIRKAQKGFLKLGKETEFNSQKDSGNNKKTDVTTIDISNESEKELEMEEKLINGTTNTNDNGFTYKKSSYPGFSNENYPSLNPESSIKNQTNEKEQKVNVNEFSAGIHATLHNNLAQASEMIDRLHQTQIPISDSNKIILENEKEQKTNPFNNNNDNNHISINNGNHNNEAYFNTRMENGNLIETIETLLRAQHAEFRQKYPRIAAQFLKTDKPKTKKPEEKKQQTIAHSNDNNNNNNRNNGVDHKTSHDTNESKDKIYQKELKESEENHPNPERRQSVDIQNDSFLDSNAPKMRVRCASFHSPREPNRPLIMIPTSIHRILSGLPESLLLQSGQLRRHSSVGRLDVWWARFSFITKLRRFYRRITDPDFPLKLILFCFVLFFTVVAFILHAPLHWAAVTGAILMLLFDAVEPDNVLSRVDWCLLVFFSSLFIVVRGFQETGIPAAVWSASVNYINVNSASGICLFSILILVGSNTVSNVPLVLLLAPSMPNFADPNKAWLLLSYVSTVAGNLTLIGSVANLIVAARSKQYYHLEFFEYLKFGLPSTLIVTVLGVVLIATIM